MRKSAILIKWIGLDEQVALEFKFKQASDGRTTSPLIATNADNLLVRRAMQRGARLSATLLLTAAIGEDPRSNGGLARKNKATYSLCHSCGAPPQPAQLNLPCSYAIYISRSYVGGADPV